MVPPRLIRRIVLAPLAIVIAVAMVVLFPPLALIAVLVSLARRSRPHRMRGLRLMYFAAAWLAAETATLFMCLGLWLASGLGGRLRTEPYQARHYAIMRVVPGPAVPRGRDHARTPGGHRRAGADRRGAGGPAGPARSSCSAGTPGRVTRCCWSASCSVCTSGGPGWS